jgi:hypothetical protein
MTTTRTIVSRVAGVSHENRQDIIRRMTGKEPCRLVPEPSNKFDPNAIAVHVAMADGRVEHVGFLPRDLAKQVSPHLEGESVMAHILEIVGGFELFNGETAAYGLRISVEIPDDLPVRADGKEAT